MHAGLNSDLTEAYDVIMELAVCIAVIEKRLERLGLRDLPPI